MAFEYIVYTPMMEEDEFFKEVDDVITILKNSNVVNIEMFYGWSWGDWISFQTVVADIMINIKKQQELTGGDFGYNDVFLTVADPEIQVVFCHEADVHIEFNRIDPIVAEVLNSWKRKGLVHCVRKNKIDISIEELVLE